MVAEASLYFHIPFCHRKCGYCHFYVLPQRPLYHDQLMEGLGLEWRARRHLLEGHTIVSIYFGGGTPSLLGPKKIGTLINWARETALAQGCEVTLEANPDTLSQMEIAQFAEVGVNRLSIGVQSFDDQLLTLLERTHTASQARSAIESACLAGIGNLSIDLMYDLPTQTLAQWRASLKQAVELPISHLSLYNLTFEPHTSFYKKRETLQKQLPSNKESCAMYQEAITTLTDGGFSQYEISAFAKEKTARSRHNSGYWQGRPFLGFGPSAWSDWEGERSRNSGHIGRWLRALKQSLTPADQVDRLNPSAKARELLVIGLRLLEGVDLEQFQTLSEETHAKLAQLEEAGLLARQDGRLFLTKRGLFLHDTIAEELI